MSDFVSKNICPITHIPVNEIYKTSTPVLAPDGYTYEKEAIERWVRDHGNSPVTRQTMRFDQLTINRVLIPSDNSSSSSSETPIKFVLAAGLDNSASMGTEAEIVNSNGKRERHGLSQLDLAKHSLVCVVESLDETSMFGLVVWSTTARIALPLTKMDKQGRAKATKIIKAIRTDGSTNLWDGIRQTQKVCDTPIAGSNPKRCAWILSDGQPNYAPPKSYAEMMIDYDKDNGSNRELRTIGYGFDSDSGLLSDIASCNKTKGSFVFIPDPGFVGTVIVHLLANCMNSHTTAEDPEETPKREAFVECMNHILMECHCNRGRFGTASMRSTQLEKAREIYELYLKKAGDDTVYQEDEISIALDNSNNWNKWGAHYIRSLMGSHQHRECINFKDPSVQGYQNGKEDAWKTLRDAAHDTYKDLPAPEPTCSGRSYGHYRGGGGSPPAATPRLATLATYSQADNGCLHEDSIVTLSNGTTMACKVVGKGSAVAVYDPSTGHTETDTIECVVKTECGVGNFAHIKSPNGGFLHITQWHPIFVDNQWQFPANLSGSAPLPSKYVYSFVLKNRGASMIFDGHPCITLASRQSGPVANHQFWGTENVVGALKAVDPDGYAKGEVCLTKDMIMRGENGYVCGIRPKSEMNMVVLSE